MVQLLLKNWQSHKVVFGMKRYLRTVSKKSDSRFAHLLSIPVDVVRKLGLSESIVEITIKEDYFIVKKIGEKLDGSSSVDEDEENKDYTIHY